MALLKCHIIYVEHKPRQIPVSRCDASQIEQFSAIGQIMDKSRLAQKVNVLMNVFPPCDEEILISMA